MKYMIKRFLSLLKSIIILSILIIGYILFVSNADVRINIKNNTNNVLHNIKILTNKTIEHRNILNSFDSYNLVFNNKIESNNDTPVIIQFDLLSDTYEKKIYPYIEINDSYTLFIQINKNGKITYQGKKLLFSINILDTFKNYWYKVFPCL